MAIGIFVPVYNDEETLADVLSAIPSLKTYGGAKIVAVDDGSSDRSYEIALRYSDCVIRHSKNKGVGAATKTGLEAICTMPDIELVVKFDADGQHDPALIPEVVEMLREGADIVICSRFHERSLSRRQMIDRTLLNTSAAYWVNQITGWNISDARSGFMGFHFEHIKRIAGDIITERYGIPIELLLRIYNEFPEVSISEIPHPARYDSGISQKLDQKYDYENISEKAERMCIAYTAFLRVAVQLGISICADYSENVHNADVW